MPDEKRQHGRDHRLTKRPPVGSAPARALTEGAPMLGAEDAEFTDMPEVAKALEAVPRGEFEDLNTDPLALDFKAQQALEKHRDKTTAIETRANLVLTSRAVATGDETNATVNRLLDIVEKQANAQAARDADEIDGKRWWRTQGAKIVAAFTSGTAVAAIIAALTRGC